MIASIENTELSHLDLLSFQPLAEFDRVALSSRLLLLKLEVKSLAGCLGGSREDQEKNAGKKFHSLTKGREAEVRNAACFYEQSFKQCALQV